MKKTLKTTTLSATLAVMFLSAGAFAGASRPTAKIATAPVLNINVTVIHKNSVWPFKGQITSRPCATVRCVAA